ncbi:unnamed protein product [Triticum turgidum subsp. durum]|uniref:Cold-regulated 413 plasma membrane protein 2 n=1 Tax=Triticum turgidum subsp. durum TaxID=4567 RepID=A0A9R0TYZ9_TRITD|nr:unnamed protein product [Triticum turgidum subsp. durum]
MAPSFLAMKAGAASGASEAAQALLESDLRELGLAARKLANHAIVLGGGLGFGRHFLKWLAFIAAVRGEVGAWIAFVVVILRLFFPRHFPDWLELPGSLILLTVVAPSLFAEHFRNDLVGVFICLAIGCYLLQEHIRVSGGFREAFRKANGVSNTIGIVLLFVYPVWVLVLWLL